MKNLLKKALITLALTTTVAACATTNLTDQPVKDAVNSVVSTGNVNVSVDNGVATLFGWVDSQITATASKNEALSFDHVDSIIDLITVN